MEEYEQWSAHSALIMELTLVTKGGMWKVLPWALDNSKSTIYVQVLGGCKKGSRAAVFGMSGDENESQLPVVYSCHSFDVPVAEGHGDRRDEACESVTTFSLTNALCRLNEQWRKEGHFCSWRKVLCVLDVTQWMLLEDWQTKPCGRKEKYNCELCGHGQRRHRGVPCVYMNQNQKEMWVIIL